MCGAGTDASRYHAHMNLERLHDKLPQNGANP